MKQFSYLMMGLLLSLVARGQNLIKAVDADDRTWILNQPGRVMVVIGNNIKTADEARACGKAMDKFQGVKDFRCLVVVDLRGSMANWSKGYTQRRMQRDLDKEAERIRKFYKNNDNHVDPRDELGAVADFDGKVCKRLNWEPKQRELRVVIFGKNGKIVKRFDPANDFAAIQKVVEAELKK